MFTNEEKKEINDIRVKLLIFGIFFTCIAELLEAIEMTFLDTDPPGTAP